MSLRGQQDPLTKVHRAPPSAPPWGQHPCTPFTNIDPFAVALRDQDSCAHAPGASHVLSGLVRAWAQPLHGAGPAAQAKPGLRVGYA